MKFSILKLKSIKLKSWFSLVESEGTGGFPLLLSNLRNSPSPATSVLISVLWEYFTWSAVENCASIQMYWLYESGWKIVYIWETNWDTYSFAEVSVEVSAVTFWEYKWTFKWSKKLQKLSLLKYWTRSMERM